MSPIFVLLFAALFAVAPARDYKKRDDTSDTLESDLNLPVVRNRKVNNDYLDVLYKPVLIFLGELPERPGEVKFYDLFPSGVVPTEEVFLYIFVTTYGDGAFQRGYYEMSTRCSRGPEFMQYMNVATGQGLLAVNSENMWFPAGTGVFKVTLTHPADKKRSIAGRTAEQNEWSGVFIIGYR